MVGRDHFRRLNCAISLDNGSRSIRFGETRKTCGKRTRTEAAAGSVRIGRTENESEAMTSRRRILRAIYFTVTVLLFCMMYGWFLAEPRYKGRVVGESGAFEGLLLVLAVCSVCLRRSDRELAVLGMITIVASVLVGMLKPV